MRTQEKAKILIRWNYYELDSNFEFNPFVSNLHVEEKITENVEY